MATDMRVPSILKTAVEVGSKARKGPSHQDRQAHLDGHFLGLKPSLTAVFGLNRPA
jgi:hypothetical protein